MVRNGHKAVLFVVAFTIILACQAKNVFASFIDNQPLCTGVDCPVDGVVIAAPSASPTAGTYTVAKSVTLSATGASSIRYTVNGSEPTCTSGSVYSSAISVGSTQTIKAISCYANGNYSTVASLGYTINISTGGNNGGGGGAATTYCSSVTYSDWSATCVGSLQTRSISSSAPSGCSLTSAQQLAAQRACQVVATSTEEVVTSTSDTTNDNSGTPNDQATNATEQLKNIVAEAATISGRNVSQVLAAVGVMQDIKAEAAAEVKYTAKLVNGLKNITAEIKAAITNFVNYGTPTTKVLGAGERAGVVNSYKSAFGKVPSTEAEWSDVIKISNGRWPSVTNVSAETKATVEFKKVYKRSPNMKNANDNAAVTVVAYGLRPANRNTNSEKAAIKSFKAIYGHTPVSAQAWDIVRAIAYSGSRR